MTVSLKLSSTQSLHFLTPERATRNQLRLQDIDGGNSADSEDLYEPNDQLPVSGTLSVRVAGRARTFKHLSVTFQSTFSVVSPTVERRRSRDLYTHTLNLHNNKSPHLHLPPGEHLFAFNFFLPHTLAPTNESLTASVRHKLKARAEVGGLLGDRRQESSLPVKLISHANSLDSSMPDPLQCTIESLSENLGPYRCDFYNESLTVGSLLRIHLLFPSPRKLEILSIRGSIEEIVDLEAGTPKASSLPTEKVRFFILDSGKKHLLERSRGTEDCLPLIEQHTSTNTGPGAKLRCLEEGEEAAFSFLARLPNCRMLRPTTLEGSDTPVKVSHALVLDVRYRTSDGIARVMSIYKNITIASCMCIADSVSLPPYERVAHSSISSNQLKALCNCGLPLESVVNSEFGRSRSLSNSSAESSDSSTPPLSETGSEEFNFHQVDSHPPAPHHADEKSPSIITAISSPLFDPIIRSQL